MALSISPENRDEIIDSLCETFGYVDRETIAAVALSCNYDINEIGCALLSIDLNDNTPAFNDTTKNINDHIRRGHKIMILMRGLPGSGKSTLARSILETTLGKVNQDEFIFASTDFFWRSGDYRYDVAELHMAHKWNENRCLESMKRGVSPVIVDNDNLMLDDMKVYCEMAANYGYVIEIAEPRTPWALDPEILAEQNTNGIKEDEICAMFEHFQMYLTVEHLNEHFNFTYKGRVPQMRKYPPFVGGGQTQSVGDSTAPSNGNYPISSQHNQPIGARNVTKTETKMQAAQSKDDLYTPGNNQVNEAKDESNDVKKSKMEEELSNLLERFSAFKQSMQNQIDKNAKASNDEGSAQNEISSMQESNKQAEKEDPMIKMMAEINEIKSSIKDISEKMTVTQLPKKSDASAGKAGDHCSKIIGFIQKGYKIMVLMRGLPGSGKTTLAHHFLTNTHGIDTPEDFVFSSNNIFVNSTNTDIFDLSEAHALNQKKCFSSMKRGVSPVIVDNNNLQLDDMKVYCLMAVEFGYMIEIVEPLTDWAFDYPTLAKNNLLGFDEAAIKDMHRNFHMNISAGDLYRIFNLTYKVEMPGYREYPALEDSK